MHQNEKKIDYQLIALMALNGLYESYMVSHNKDDLCYDLSMLLDFAYKHDSLYGLFLEAVNLLIVSEDLIKWQKER